MSIHRERLKRSASQTILWWGALVAAGYIMAAVPSHAQSDGTQVSAGGTARPKIVSEGRVPLGRGGYDPQVFVSEGSNIKQPDIYVYHEPVIFIRAKNENSFYPV